MNHFIPSALCILLWAAVSPRAAVVAPNPEDSEPYAVVALRAAYMTIIDAELAADAGRWSNAAAAYADALAQFERIANRYPGWQLTMIDARIANCRNSLDEMRQRLACGADASLPVGKSAAQDDARRQQLRDELRNARAWLAAPGVQDDGVARLGRIMSLERSCAELKAHVSRLSEERDRLAGKLHRIERNYPFLAGRAVATNFSAYPQTTEIIRDQVRRYLKVGEHGLAIALLQEARELMPGDLTLVVMLGTAMCIAGNYEGALVLLTRGVPAEQVTTEIRILRGSAQMALGNLGAARVEMEKVLKKDPTSAAAHYNMAQLLVALTPPDGEKAREHYALSLNHGGAPDKQLEQAIREARLIDKIKKTKSSAPRPQTVKNATFPPKADGK